MAGDRFVTYHTEKTALKDKPWNASKKNLTVNHNKHPRAVFIYAMISSN